MEQSLLDGDGFGDRLRSLRREAGLTQKELAGDRFSHAYISSLESGRRSPSPAALLYLSGRLGTDLARLFPPGRGDLSEVLEHLPLEGTGAACLLEAVLRAIGRGGDVSLKADVLRLVGEFHMSERPEVAEELLLKAADLYRRAAADAPGLGRTLFLLGSIAESRGENDVALVSYREAASVLATPEGASLSSRRDRC